MLEKRRVATHQNKLNTFLRKQKKVTKSGSTPGASADKLARKEPVELGSFKSSLERAHN